MLILTPMAVRPDRQRAGVGKQVVRAAIAAAEARGEPVVLVEGVPSYYPQFGFRSASELGFERPDQRIPEAAWLALPLAARSPRSRAPVVYPDFFPPPPGARAPGGRERPRAIAPVLEGRRLERVEIEDARLTRPEDPLVVAAELTGERVEHVDRRGKYLILRFASGRALLIHLRMTAASCASRARPAPASAAAARRWSTVGYRDVRRFGTWLLLEPGELEPYLGARLGEEPLVAAFTAKGLGERLEGRRAPLKAALLDQRTLAGLGNIYVDEALWYARLHPLRPAGLARPRRAPAPAPCDQESLELGIARQGSTLSDYRLPDGSAGMQSGSSVPTAAPDEALRPLRHGAREDAGRRPRHLVLPALPDALTAREKARGPDVAGPPACRSAAAGL